MENLILYCGNKAQGDERIMNILEIIVLILREQVGKIMIFHTMKVILIVLQSAEELAYTGEQQSKNQRQKNNEYVMIVLPIVK